MKKNLIVFLITMIFGFGDIGCMDESARMQEEIRKIDDAYTSIARLELCDDLKSMHDKFMNNITNINSLWDSSRTIWDIVKPIYEPAIFILVHNRTKLGLEDKDNPIAYSL